MTSYYAPKLVALATSQYGPFAREQLRALGMSERQIDLRVERGEFVVLHPAVYALTAPDALRVEGKWFAAVLACGDEAWLSHQCAGALRRIVVRYDGMPQVSVAHDNAPHIRGIWTRKTTLYPYERGSKLRIPCTSLARTILDLSNVLPPNELARSFQRALRQGLTFKQVERLLDRHWGERGTVAVRDLLAIHRDDAGMGKGGYEDAFYAFLLDILPPGFPRPKRNHLMRLSDGTWIEADLYFANLRTIFELDYYPHHQGDRMQTTLDLQRDRDVRNDGWKLERFGSDEFERNRARVERDVRRLLGI